jgi:hypothetical protein
MNTRAWVNQSDRASGRNDRNVKRGTDLRRRTGNRITQEIRDPAKSLRDSSLPHP